MKAYHFCKFSIIIIHQKERSWVVKFILDFQLTLHCFDKVY